MNPSLSDRYWTCLSAIILIFFLGVQVYSMVLPIRHFSWIEFSDEDDSFQVEQFLRISGERGVPALLDNPVSHGSELLVIGPLYGIVRTLFRLPPLAAFYYLKAIHMGCSVLSLACLPWIVRRSGWPKWVGPVSMALVAFNPLFFNSAPLLKEDSNLVLAAVMISILCLFQFDGTERKRWLVFSIGASAVGAAVKWWGVFLLPAQIYVVVTKSQTLRPLLTRKAVVFLNVIVGALWIWVAAIQLRYLNHLFPEYGRLFPSLSVVVTAVGFSVAAVIALHYWIQKLRCGWAKWVEAGIAVGEIFTMLFTLVLSPLLVGPEFPHSVRYFSKYLGVRSSSAGLLGGLWNNIAGWGTALRTESGISWPLVVLLSGSLFVLGGKRVSSVVRSQMAILWIFLLPLCAFLFLFVTKFNPPTLALMFPFLVLVALVPISQYGEEGPVVARRWIFPACIGLSLCALALNFPSISAIVRGARMLPQKVKSLNLQLEAGFPEGKVSEILTLGREFPFLEDDGRFAPFDRFGLEREIGKMVEGCLDGRKRERVAIVLGESRESVMGTALRRLEASACAVRAWDLAVDSQKRGHGIRRTYRAVLWESPRNASLNGVRRRGG